MPLSFILSTMAAALKEPGGLELSLSDGSFAVLQLMDCGDGHIELLVSAIRLEDPATEVASVTVSSGEEHFLPMARGSVYVFEVPESSGSVTSRRLVLRVRKRRHAAVPSFEPDEVLQFSSGLASLQLAAGAGEELAVEAIVSSVPGGDVEIRLTPVRDAMNHTGSWYRIDGS